MKSKLLGTRIRELRLARDISLRQLAARVEISPPFLSDIELGRRHPSRKVLTRIAAEVGVSFEYLSQYDARPSVTELKRLAETDGGWSLALRTAAEQIKAGDLTAEGLLERLGATEPLDETSPQADDSDPDSGEASDTVSGGEAPDRGSA